MDAEEVKSVVEALLFATDVPLTLGRLEALVDNGQPAAIREAIEHLNQEYWEHGNAFPRRSVCPGKPGLTLVPMRPRGNEQR